MSIPAPDWLLNADYFNGPGRAAGVAKGDASAGEACAFCVVGHPPADERARAISALHDDGCRALPYVSFLDTFSNTGGFERGTGRLPFSDDLADCLLLDKDGRFVNTLMDGTYRWNRYLVCVNTATYAERMLAHVQDLLDGGADGLFVDNVHPQEECCGHGLRVGYLERYRMVVAESPNVTQFDPSLQELPVHTHLHPELTYREAFGKFLQKVRDAVKARNPDHVVVHNGVTDYAEQADACMYESFICSWGHLGRKMTWAQAKEGTARHRAVVDMKRAVVALSYLGRTETTVKDDAFFCYTAARLLGFLWSDYGTGDDDAVGGLRQARLGAPDGDLQTSGEVDYRVFPGGIVAMNDGEAEQEVAIPIGDGAGSAFTDVYDGAVPAAQDGMLSVRIPAHSGRVYQRVT